MAQGQKLVQNASAAEIARVIALRFPDSDLELFEIVTRRHKDTDAWNSVPVMTEAAFNRLLDIMDEAGELSVRVSFADIVNNSFANKIS